MQAEYYALTQAAKLGAEVTVKIEKVRTSSEVFSDVAITTSNGIEKNRQVQTSSRPQPDAADPCLPVRPSHRFFRASSK